MTPPVSGREIPTVAAIAVIRGDDGRYTARLVSVDDSNGRNSVTLEGDDWTVPAVADTLEDAIRAALWVHGLRGDAVGDFLAGPSAPARACLVALSEEGR